MSTERTSFALSLAALAAVVVIGATSPQVAAQDAKAPARPAMEKPADKKAVRLTIAAPWARATPGGAKVGAVFLEIRAEPGADDRLLSASSPIAQTVELHDHIKDGGIMRMRRVEAIPVAGGKSVVLKPGGLHVMLIDLKGPLTEGESVELTLTFEKAGAIKVAAPIQKVGAMAGPPDAGSGPGSGPGHDHPGSGSGPGNGAKQ